MNQTLRVISASTSKTNTPESDRQPRVWHTVHLSDGTEEEVYATDPMDAIEMMRNKLKYRAEDAAKKDEQPRGGLTGLNDINLSPLKSS